MDALNRAGTAHPALAGVKAILFDKDGTLLDFEATWGPATAKVLSDLAGGDGKRFADLADAAGFLPATHGFMPGSPVIGGHADEFLPTWAKLLETPCDDAFRMRALKLYHEASLASLTGYGDVAPVLERLRNEGFAIGLATNDAEATAQAHLDRLDIAGLFDFVAGFDSGFGGKPEPGMVTAFAATVSLPPSAIALVGDSPHDMLAATAAGAVPVGIARTRQAALALRELPSLTVPDLEALVAALGLNG